MPDKKSDPTEDPEFQRVVDHFLKTPPTPHGPKRPDKGQKRGRPKPGQQSSGSED